MRFIANNSKHHNTLSELAEVVPGIRGSVIRLPPEFSRATVNALLRLDEQLSGTVVMGPADISNVGSIAPEQWAIIAPAGFLRLAPKNRPAIHLGNSKGHVVFVFPKHTLELPKCLVSLVLSALETVKPEKLDSDGRPLPWIPAVHLSSAPDLKTGRDDDVCVEDSEVLPTCPQPENDDGSAVIVTSTIRKWFSEICATLSFHEIPLIIKRGQADRRGFVSGSIEITSQFVPRRIVINTCPNADQAEIVTTLVHEIAHSLARSKDHGPVFCQSLVELAERLWGEPYFVAARSKLAGPCAILDRWVSSGIRAALTGREPPASKVCDDGHAARIISKITKLWALASDQLGKPEAIGATALANDMITIYGLDGSQACSAPSIDDQLADRFILLDPRQPWQRSLAHDVAFFNGVFSLSMNSQSRMHFFGRYSDVVAAEYLCVISIERIKRECAAHIEKQRSYGLLAKSEIRRATAAFCDSAVYEFGLKLDRILAEESARSSKPTEQVVAFNEAESFAQQQCSMRGILVSSRRNRKVYHSSEGAEAGRRMQVVRGLDSQGRPPLQLSGPK